MLAVDISNIHKTIKKNDVLRGLSLQARYGEVVGIIGTNGSGKTTLLRIISGLTSVNEGVVKVFGKTLNAASPLPQGIGTVFDPPALLADLSGLQNLIVISKIRNIMTNAELRELMLKVGLNPDDKRKVAKYSQGMKKRLGLAIAMMENPRLVLMDEPTNGLDPDAIIELRRWISELKSNGACVVVVGHYLEEMNAISDTLYKMENGTLNQVSIQSIRERSTI